LRIAISLHHKLPFLVILSDTAIIILNTYCHATVKRKYPTLHEESIIAIGTDYLNYCGSDLLNTLFGKVVDCGVLYEPVKPLAARLRCAAVEVERELVEIVREMGR
jgi:hypothetical protein